MSSSTIPVEDSTDLLGLGSTSRLVLQMARRDIATLFRTPWIIISRSLAFIIQLFVFAYLMGGLITSYQGFFGYYAVGSVVTMVASISFIIGYDIFEEAEEGGYIGYVAELPGANTQGETLEETRENLAEAIQLILEANREQFERQLQPGSKVKREQLVLRAA